MEAAIRDLLRDPVIGLPVLCVVLLLTGLVAGILRSAANGTFVLPAVNAWSRDLAKVGLIALALWASKLTALFIPEGNIEVGGIDIAPILSVAAPAVFFAAGAAAAATFIAVQVKAILTSLTPPTATQVVDMERKVARAAAIGDPIPKP